MEPLKLTPNAHTVPSWALRSDDLQYCLYHPSVFFQSSCPSPTESMRKGRYVVKAELEDEHSGSSHAHPGPTPALGLMAGLFTYVLRGPISVPRQVPPAPEVLGRNLLLASSRFSAAGIAYPVATPYCPQGQHLQISLCSIFMPLCPLWSPNSLCLCYNNTQYCAKGPPG